MPEDGLEQLKKFDAIFLGAVGFPGVPDHISLWGLLLPIRRAFNQYVNLRPVRLFDGIKCPLADKNREILIFMSCVKTLRGNILRLAVFSTKVRMKKWYCNKAFLPVKVPTVS